MQEYEEKGRDKASFEHALMPSLCRQKSTLAEPVTQLFKLQVPAVKSQQAFTVYFIFSRKLDNFPKQYAKSKLYTPAFLKKIIQLVTILLIYIFFRDGIQHGLPDEI